MSDVSEQNSDTPQENNPAPAENAPQENAAQENAAQILNGIPDGLPEQYWDAESGQIKTDELVGSYKELNQFKTEYDERLSKRPESADKYELRVPEGVELPEGVEWQFDENSDLLKAARQFAYDAGYGQEKFDDLVGQYIQEKVGQKSEALTQAEETYQAEMSALGEQGEARIEAVNAYLTANLPEEKAKALQSGITSKAALEALEDLIGNAGGTKLQSGSQGTTATSITQDQLDEMIKDPRYWREKDPAFVRQVEDGYKKLYPGPQQRIN